MVAGFDNAHVLKLKDTPVILVAEAAVKLNKLLPTQLIEPLNAEYVVALLSIALVITLVEYIANSVLTEVGRTKSCAV